MMKAIECDPKCGFMVKSHDEKEVMNMGMEHAKKAHKMKVSMDDAKKMMKDV